MKIISETQYGENSKTTKWEVASVDNLPFVSTFKKKKSNRKFSPNWAGVGFGFVNAFNDDVSIDFGASKEIFWNIFDVGVPLYDNCFGLVFGFGMDWRNYVLNGNKRFYRENHKVMIEDMPDYVDVKKSRIKTVDIVIPVMFEWQKYMKEYLYVQFGAQVNFRTHTSMKTLYYQSADGLPTPAKENMNGIGTNPMGLDLVVRAGYGFLGFYAKYSPTRMFQSDKGPQINSFSTGFIVTY